MEVLPFVEDRTGAELGPDGRPIDVAEDPVQPPPNKPTNKQPAKKPRQPATAVAHVRSSDAVSEPPALEEASDPKQTQSLNKKKKKKKKKKKSKPANHTTTASPSADVTATKPRNSPHTDGDSDDHAPLKQPRRAAQANHTSPELAYASDADSDSSAPEEIRTTRSKSRTRPAAQRQQAAKRVWVDEDDERERVDLLAVPRRKKLRTSENDKVLSAKDYSDRVRNLLSDKASARGATGTWAELPADGPVVVRSDAPAADAAKDSADEDFADDGGAGTGDPDVDDDEKLSADVRALLRSSGSRRRPQRRAGALPSGIIRARPVANANKADPSRCEASCVEFHPSGRLLLTAGLDKTARLFSVDGDENARVQAVHLHNFPIRSAAFVRGGDAAVFTARQRSFHALDLQSGTATVVRSLGDRDDKSWERVVADARGARLAFAGTRGKVVLVDAVSLRETAQLRLNGRVGAMAFGPAAREHELLTATEDGVVQLWDVRTLRCVDRHIDEGAVHTTCMASSEAHYATGSDSGVCNVYDANGLARGAADAPGGALVSQTRVGKPLKALFNLSTPIDHACFSPDGQILAYASHAKKAAVRLVHTASMTVFRNWPSERARVLRVCSMAFSPGGGYLALGNDRGAVQMLRLLDYPAC